MKIYLVKHYEKILFIVCGITSALVYFLILYLLNVINFFSLSINLTIAYVSGSIYNFIFNKYITFKAGKYKFIRHSIFYIIMLLFIMIFAEAPVIVVKF